MMYILSDSRDRDVNTAFAKYRAYLEENKLRFPPSAWGLANASWYFAFTDPNGPHDAWLKSLTMEETYIDEEQVERGIQIRIRLLNAFHDRILELTYPHVRQYSMELLGKGAGHSDWRYDEFRLTEDGCVVHEIEWAGASDTARWTIVASDVHFRSIPLPLHDE